MSNDFLVWAPSGGNVMSQANYAANSALANGIVNGIGDPTLANKSWRQSSIIAAVIAQLIVDVTGGNAVDDGTTATLEAALASTIRLGGGYVADTSGVANTITLTLAPAPAAYVAGMIFRWKMGHSVTGATVLNANALGAKALVKTDGTAIAAGDLPINTMCEGIYNGTSVVLLSATANALRLTDFTGANQSLGASGYQMLPGGLIMQWGGFGGTTGALDGNGIAEVAGIVVTLPLTFPNAFYRVVPVAHDVVGGGLQEQASGNVLSTSTFSGSLSCRQATTAMTADYIAFGR